MRPLLDILISYVSVYKTVTYSKPVMVKHVVVTHHTSSKVVTHTSSSSSKCVPSGKQCTFIFVGIPVQKFKILNTCMVFKFWSKYRFVLTRFRLGRGEIHSPSLCRPKRSFHLFKSYFFMLIKKWDCL